MNSTRPERSKSEGDTTEVQVWIQRCPVQEGAEVGFLWDTAGDLSTTQYFESEFGADFLLRDFTRLAWILQEGSL